MEVTYRKESDYLIPNLAVSENNQPIGKYGMLRRTYIKQSRPSLYSTLMITGKLTQHLLQIDRTAKERIEQMVSQMTKQENIPDKATNQMAWVQMMNNLRHSAEETVLTELVYN